jgi:hypothetical protein
MVEGEGVLLVVWSKWRTCTMIMEEGVVRVEESEYITREFWKF